MTQTRKENKKLKDEKKTESTRTLIQRVKAMKASKVKKLTETINSSKGEKLAHAKEANLKELKRKQKRWRNHPRLKLLDQKMRKTKTMQTGKYGMQYYTRKKTRNLKLTAG